MDKKVILITGASSGMGLETAKDLVKQGHIVYGASRHIDTIKEAGAFPIVMDMTKDATIVAGVKKIIKEQGRIDVLWNNAGFGLYGSVEETSLEDARYQFEVNLFGLARLTQLVTPHMRNQKSGTIVNTSSMGGKMYTPLGAWYHGTKHAVEGFSDCLRFELAPFGIHVVILEPGAIATHFGDVMTAPMMKRSGKGPYKKLALAMERVSKESFKQGGGSPPSVISRTLSKIVASKRPKTRYVVGKMAKPMMFVRKWFGDRIFDRLLRIMAK